jgi:heme/copper-type cytochrome/quinol oxidase subunit 2
MELIIDNWLLFSIVFGSVAVMLLTVLFLMGASKKNKEYDEAFEKTFNGEGGQHKQTHKVGGKKAV